MTRSARSIFTVCALLCAFAARAPVAQAAGDSSSLPVLTSAEKAAGWKLLFDGETTAGWRGIKTPEFPAKGWVAENGTLHCLPKSGGGDIITAGKYNNFEFSWEWRMASNGNSGVKYLILPERGAIGPEYQMLDDFNHAESKHGAKRTAASIYDVLAPKGAQIKPIGQWNQSRIVLRGKHVEHWLNSVKVLECELESDAVRAAIAESKFKKTSFYGVKTPGHILLQDHGTETWFRNLRLRELPEK